MMAGLAPYMIQRITIYCVQPSCESWIRVSPKQRQTLISRRDETWFILQMVSVLFSGKIYISLGMFGSSKWFAIEQSRA